MPLLEGRTGIIFGVANKRSIAWAIAQALAREGMRLAFTYQGDRLKEGVETLANTLPGSVVLPCDVTSDSDIESVFRSTAETLGKLETPGNITVKRRKYDINIKCEKPGYQEAEYLNKSGLSSMVAGNVAADLILTAGLSSIVDSANGADNEYTPTVVISLNPITASQPGSTAARSSGPQANFSSISRSPRIISNPRLQRIPG